MYALCTTCHGGGVASTDVVHGTLDGLTNVGNNDPKKLNGGGFVQQNGAAVTSRHMVEGVPINGVPWTGVDTAWGSQDGVGDAGVGVQGVLECTSCHNPHGSTNYRILKDRDPFSRLLAPAERWVPNDPDILNYVAYQVLATQDDQGNYGFDLTNPADCPINPTAAAGKATPWPGAAPNTGTHCVSERFTSGVVNATPANAVDAAGNQLGMNAFCATCHKSYLTRSGSAYAQNSLNTPVNTVGPGTPTPYPAYVFPGTQDALDNNGNIARYRHTVDRNYGGYPKQPLRFAAMGIDPAPSAGSLSYTAFGCLTCHYAHGSSAAADGPAAGVAPTNDSALLFWDNRGVCVSCHQKVGPNAPLTPTAVPPTPTP